MENKKFKFSNLFRDGAGKESSKRMVGIFAGSIGILMGILGGFHFYEIDNSTLVTILTFSGGLLGISIFTKEG